MELEFGNQEHIKILEKEKELNERIKELDEWWEKRGGVGRQEVPACGKCYSPSDECETTIGDYLVCTECGSIIDKI